MSVARSFLRLPADADDAALLGVVHGATREAVVAAGRRRLAQAGQWTALTESEHRAYRMEIQAAAYRLASGLLSPSGSSRASSGPRRSFSRRAMVLMRRDPRRARMFLAAGRAPQRLKGFDTSGARDTRGGAEVARLPLPAVDPDMRTGVPWVLLCIVVISLIALIGEIVIATRDLGASSDAARNRETPSTPETQSPPAARRKSEPPVLPSSTPAPAGGTMAKDPQVPVQKVLGESAGASGNEEARALRQRWQRTTSAAFAISLGEIGPLATDRLSPGDPLLVPLRQAMLLERLMALHAAARDLVAGEDSNASRTLDTLPTDAVITVPAAPAAVHSTAGADDGQLAAMLQRVPGSTEARAALLRNYKTRGSPPGPTDARTLVHEALKGPSRATRTLARAILVARGADSLDTMEAVEERYSELALDPASAGVIRAVADVDPQGTQGFSGARAAIVAKILAARGSRTQQIEAAEHALSATMAAAIHRGRPGATVESPARLVAALSPPPSRGTHSWALPGGGHSLNALAGNLTALLRLEGLALAERRKADEPTILQAIVDASHERSASISALAQAIADLRGLLVLDAIELGVASPRGTPPAAVSRADRVRLATPLDPALSERWARRLESLEPTNAEAYLELAEEISADADHSSARLLAGHLASLAGVLDPQALGASAALMMASLEDPSAPDATDAVAQWRAAARLFGAGGVAKDPAVGVDALQAGSVARLAVVDALAQYRRGYGRRASDRLKDPRSRDLFERAMESVPGSALEFDRLAAVHVAGEPPALDAATLDSILRLERALLQPESDSWIDAISLGRAGAAVDAPIGSPQEIFGVDPSLSVWRDGRWVRTAGAPQVR